MAGESNQVKWRGVQPVNGIRGVWPAIDSERIYPNGYVGASSTLILYTVAAGKLAFISGAFLTSKLNSNTNTTAWILIRDVSDVTVINVMTHYYYVPGQNATSLIFSPAVEVPAGYDIVVVCYAGTIQARAGIYGWLEDA